MGFLATFNVLSPDEVNMERVYNIVLGGPSAGQKRQHLLIMRTFCDEVMVPNGKALAGAMQPFVELLVNLKV